LHAKTAAAVLGVDIAAVTKEQRQLAKAVNFGLLYGQGAKGLVGYAYSAYGVDMTLEQAKAARQAFFNAYPDLASWQCRQGREAKWTRKAITPAGRIRDFRKEASGFRYTEALNTPISGGAAEVLMATLGILDHKLGTLDAKLVNVVHDELVLEVAEHDAPATRKIVEAAMFEGYLLIFPGGENSVTDLVEAHAGTNWGAAKR
jgi:DNA polymerase I-like protein with 3'-5' exonuclease and polymerase domains